jgi:hypothetical protein
VTPRLVGSDGGAASPGPDAIIAMELDPSAPNARLARVAIVEGRPFTRLLPGPTANRPRHKKVRSHHGISGAYKLGRPLRGWPGAVNCVMAHRRRECARGCKHFLIRVGCSSLCAARPGGAAARWRRRAGRISTQPQGRPSAGRPTRATKHYITQDEGTGMVPGSQARTALRCELYGISGAHRNTCSLTVCAR